MPKKVLWIAIIWILVFALVYVLYLLQEVPPVKEFIDWAISVWPILAALGGIGILISGWVIKHDFSKPEEKMSDIMKAKHDCANIEVKPRVSGNLAILEVKNIGVDADFTAEAVVVKGVPPHTSYTMCWNSTPHLEHPIKRGGTSTIIVAEVESAIAELAGRVRGGLLLYQIGLSGQIEKVGATTQELRNTVELNIRYPTMAEPVDDSCTIEITITSTPSLLTPFDNQKYKIEIDHEQGYKLLIAPLPELETHIKLELGKLLLDGKEILVDLEKMNGQLDAVGAASAELKLEIWYKDVSKTLQNTDYDRLWFENKEGLDYRTAKKSDYVEACKYGLGRLEYIKQLIFDKEGSQSLGDGIQPKSYDKRDVIINNEPEISIDIDKCSWGNSVIRDNQSVQIIEVALTLKVKSPPVNITDLQLYMGDEMLKLLSPVMPITQENKRACYIAEYELTLATIYKVAKDNRDKYHIRVVTKRQEVDSEVFSINNP